MTLHIFSSMFISTASTTTGHLYSVGYVLVSSQLWSSVLRPDKELIVRHMLFWHGQASETLHPVIELLCNFINNEHYTYQQFPLTKAPIWTPCVQDRYGTTIAR